MKAISLIVLFAMISLESYSQNLGRNSAFHESAILLDSLYKNNRIQKDLQGSLYEINSLDEKKFVYVYWVNGYTSLGTIKNGVENGKWYLFDKKGRLRKYVSYSLDGSYLLTFRRYNKRGKQIEMSFTSPPF